MEQRLLRIAGVKWLFPLALVACHHTPEARSISCDSHRVTLVRTSNVDRRTLAPLTVLEGTYDDPQRTDRLVALTEAMLRSKGYANAHLAIARHAGCGVELDVRATLGPRFRIARIDAVTDDAFPEGARRAILSSNLGTINAVGGTYRADLLAAQVDELRNTYHDRGWLQAEIEKPEVSYDVARAEITVRVPIKAGLRFKIGEVKPRQAGTETTAAIAALGLRTGAWYDITELRIAVARAARKLGHPVDLFPSTLYDRGVVNFAVEVTK